MTYPDVRFYYHLAMDQKSNWLWGWAIVGMTLVAYSYATMCGYIWDDDMYVYMNPTLLSFEGLRDIWLKPGATPQYYPLVFSGFWIEHKLWGLDPMGYHVVNILLHAANAVLIWRLMLRLEVPGAWLIAAIFAVHPVNVESVAWVTERKNVLSMFFYLLAALSLFKWNPPAQDTAMGQRNWRWFGVALVLFVFALLSKTTACTLPAAWLLVVWWKRAAIPVREWLSMSPFFALGLVFGLVTVYLEKKHVGAEGAEWAFNAVERVQIAGNVVLFYASKLLWPSSLSFVYPRWEIDMARPVLYIGPVVVLGLCFGLWKMRAKIGRGPLTAWLFFIGTLFPALGFFNVYPFRYSFVADHFQYLATFGFIALVVGAATTIVSRYEARTAQLAAVRTALAAVILLGLSAHTWAHTLAYTDAEALWRDTLSKNPRAWLASNNLGILLRDRGDYPQASVYFLQTVNNNPGMLEGRMNLAELLIELGQPAQAMEHIQAAQAIEPRHPEPYMALGRSLAMLGQAEASRDQYGKALAIYEAVIRTNPTSVLGLFGLARAYNAVERGGDAVPVLERLLTLTPNDALAWSELGMAQLKAGNVQRALAAYANALKLSPGNSEVMNRMALIYAATDDPGARNPEQALILAQEAVRVTNRRAPRYLDTLGMALAAMGRFDEARQVSSEAIALASSAGFAELVRQFQSHESLYVKRQPVRMSAAELAR